LFFALAILCHGYKPLEFVDTSGLPSEEHWRQSDDAPMLKSVGVFLNIN